MIYNIRLISGEVDDFLMDISVDGADTFLTLHQFIQAELGYDPAQMASFFTTDQHWQKETEITLLDMGDTENPDLVVMEKAAIADYIQSVRQRLLYVFDLFSERAFFMEVSGMKEGMMDEPECNFRQGEPPVQIELGSLLGDDAFNDEFEAEEELDEFFSHHEDFDNESDFENLGLDIYNEEF
jgi:hypothetical protein